MKSSLAMNASLGMNLFAAPLPTNFVKNFAHNVEKPITLLLVFFSSIMCGILYV